MSGRIGVVLLTTLLCVPAFAQNRGQRGGQNAQAAQPQTAEQPGTQAPATNTREIATAAEEKISKTSHSVRLDGREIKYTATTGTLPIRLDDGKVAARMFFVAYT